MKKHPFRPLGLIMMLVLIGLASGCQTAGTTETTAQPTVETTHATQPTEPDPVETDAVLLPGDRPNQPGGALRLWQLAAEDPNPLLATDPTQLAVNDLIYESLYRIEVDTTLTPQLIRELSETANTTSVTLSLRPGQRFHNGQTITAEDVAACLNFILTHPDQSGYAADLALIETVEVESPTRLRLALSQPDPWLAYALVFPVIPAEWLSQPNTDLIPGSGPFRMTRIREDGTIVLTLDQLTFDSSELRQIEIKSYLDLPTAMQAFSNDELDLVLMSASEYASYSRRSHLRFSSFPGHDMVLAHLQTTRGVLADHEVAFLTIKNKLLHLPFDTLDSQVIRQDLPLPPGCPLDDSNGPSQSEIIQQLLGGHESELNPQTTDQPLRVIWPEQDPERTELAALLGLQLDLAAISWEGQALSPDDFRTAWDNGRYDIALVAARLPNPPDPSWLYLFNGRLTLADEASNRSVSSGVAGVDEWLNLLDTIWHQQPPADRMADRETGLLMNHLAARSNWQALLVREQALLYGDRVIGSSQPNFYHPYEGIEELWVWSSLSSSSS